MLFKTNGEFHINTSKDTFINYRYEEFNTVYQNEIPNSSIIKINNGGNWNLYVKTSSGYNLIGQKNGTIELKTELYDYTTHRFGFDMEGFDYELLDTEPQIETRNIIDAVDKDIFINELESEMNKLNFVMLRYVLKEQPFDEYLQGKEDRYWANEIIKKGELGCVYLPLTKNTSIYQDMPDGTMITEEEKHGMRQLRDILTFLVSG